MAVAHLGHAELRVTDLEAARYFYTEIIGLYVTEEDDEHVYLRAWQDWDHHTLTLSKADEPGLDHVGWRVERPEDLPAYEKRLGELGVEHHWLEGGKEPGQGDGLRFLTPGGMPFELYWEVERFVPGHDGQPSRLPSHPQRFGSRGMAPRRFDHMNFLQNEPARDQEWLANELGIHHRYYVEGSGGERLGSWMSRTNISHEVAIMRGQDQGGTRLHHAAYFLDSPDQLLRAATILADNGARIEWGPGQHGTSGAMFLYCFDPAGNRIEVWTGGMLIFAPDWEPIRWDSSVGSLGLELWGSDVPDTYFTYGTDCYFSGASSISAAR